MGIFFPCGVVCNLGIFGTCLSSRDNDRLGTVGRNFICRFAIAWEALWPLPAFTLYAAALSLVEHKELRFVSSIAQCGCLVFAARGADTICSFVGKRWGTALVPAAVAATGSGRVPSASGCATVSRNKETWEPKARLRVRRLHKKVYNVGVVDSTQFTGLGWREGGKAWATEGRLLCELRDSLHQEDVTASRRVERLLLVVIILVNAPLVLYLSLLHQVRALEAPAMRLSTIRSMVANCLLGLLIG